MSMNMKETFERDIVFTVDCIVKDSQEEDEKNETLERFIACLVVAMEEAGSTRERAKRKLESFRYIVAAMCLSELKRFQKSLGLQFPL